jgi:hypothetical protein
VSARRSRTDEAAFETVLLAWRLLRRKAEDANMKQREVEIVMAREARRVLTGGDLKSEVAFQNDINTLLARLDEKQPPLRALSNPQPGS